ncbi:glycosyltransferase [Sphingomonas sp.]|uniref:glycosyltransferase n=1 Tax=Sphingomonas sp. TaxID=28214 RepID=UPI0025CD6A65|nr:glycosyltransferase [Sphingomonas sp.]
MILLTVGTQLPFDRFVKIVDEAAPGIGTPIFAQTGYGSYEPKNMEWQKMLRPSEFDEILSRATCIVSHAGVGTVVIAQKYRKPVILFPRRAALKEHRNDHQMATIGSLEGRQGVYIARTDAELIALLGQPLLPPDESIEIPSRIRLREAIVKFIEAN